jgi:deazaflavin-dependent oxidoreductase (nitroreductase family)
VSLVTDLGIGPVSRSPLARSIRWFAGTRFGAATLSRTLRHLDRWALAASRGRMTFSDLFGGVPTIFLTTTGARTGLARTAQLAAVPVATDLAVIGSNFGRSSHPAWVANLLADPHATVRHGSRTVPVTAHEATGAEAERVWAAALEVHPGFANYPAMTPGRTIRVFLLKPR